MIPDAISACQWSPDPYIFFSGNVFSALIYYSHFTPIIVSLLFSIYIFVSNKKSLINKIFLFVTLVLSIWLLLDLVTWASDSIQVVIFAWAITNMIEPAIYAGFVYFVLVFTTRKEVSLLTKFIIVLPLLPTIIAGASHWNIIGFNLTNCDRELIEGPIPFYNYMVEAVYVLTLLGIGVSLFVRKNIDRVLRNQSLSVIVVILILLSGFAIGNIVGSSTQNWAVGQYGLFVIPVCMGTLSYFIVQFRFQGRSQMMAAQILIVGLWLAIGSIFFIRSLTYIYWVTGVTLVFLSILGYLLLRSFKHEIMQRMEIENLAKDLESANDQQIVLIHFITHQIKGFVTKSRNIFSILLDGDMGALPETIRPMIEEGLRSDTKGVETIQEILNASNIKTGKMSYTMEPFNLTALVQEIIQFLQPAVKAKGLILTAALGEQPITFTGDRAQLTNAFKNLIDNSIKYTPQGSVSITLSQDAAGVVRFEIQDTGVGITPEDMKSLFTEGGHGKESQKVNTESTGFGLYIVKNIIVAHQGKVWAESMGPGKGAHFIVEFPSEIVTA
jgi:signal transduction histidine kinase